MNRRDYDDDDRRGGRSNRGWSGDPEGHSEAAERGWESRRGGRNRYSSDDDFDDDYNSRNNRGRSSSRYDEEEDNGRGRSGRGWYGDPQGHSEAGRGRNSYSNSGRGSSRYDDDDRYNDYNNRDRSSSRYDEDEDSGRGRSGRGWYGDPQGHSEASERGWESRGGGRRSHSSGFNEDEDYDDRGGRSASMGRSRGRSSSRSSGRGWYGDSEGHSEAAEKGWQNR